MTSAPTMRMVVDLGDLDASRWVNQSGVSGHAFHRHYDDQTELWANQRMWPFVSSRGGVEARTDTRQELRAGELAACASGQTRQGNSPIHCRW